MFKSNLTRIVIIKRNIIARGMLTATRNLIYRGKISNYSLPQRIFSRDSASWAACSRTDGAYAIKNPEPMAIDPETGLEIMRTFDASHKNHYLLVDLNYKNPLYYKIHGSFTSSSTAYKDVYPHMISSHTLEGFKKPQFLHYYEKPRLILKTAVIVHEEATLVLGETPTIVSYLETIVTDT